MNRYKAKQALHKKVRRLQSHHRPLFSSHVRESAVAANYFFTATQQTTCQQPAVSSPTLQKSPKKFGAVSLEEGCIFGGPVTQSEDGQRLRAAVLKEKW